jgi:hypothetical protein
MASSSGGYRNIFGEDRITPPLFDDTAGSEVSKVVSRWFFGAESHSGSASISGKGSLAGAIQKGGRGTATISALGHLAVLGLAGMLGLASISGGGAQAVAGQKAAIGDTDISGAGSLSGSGSKATSGAASLSGRGSITAAGPPVQKMVMESIGLREISLRSEVDKSSGDIDIINRILSNPWDDIAKKSTTWVRNEKRQKDE